jgi:hypothetical protein
MRVKKVQMSKRRSVRKLNKYYACLQVESQKKIIKESKGSTTLINRPKVIHHKHIEPYTHPE